MEQYNKASLQYKLTQAVNGVEQGWHRILIELVNQCHELDPEFEILQVKEKFGGLRFYFRSSGKHSQELAGLVRKAEADAHNTCEYCGEPGEWRETNWCKTLCDKHYQQVCDGIEITPLHPYRFRGTMDDICRYIESISAETALPKKED